MDSLKECFGLVPDTLELTSEKIDGLKRTEKVFHIGIIFIRIKF